MNSKMSPEKARALRDEVQKGHVRHRPSPFAPQPGTRKHRELRFDARHHDEIDQVRKLLEGLEGIDVADGSSAGSLSIWYELHDYTLKGLETALVNQGVHLNNSLHCRLMRMMIAYAGINNLVIPLLALTGANRLLAALTTTPWLGFARGAIITLLLALSVSFFTKRGCFWRT